MSASSCARCGTPLPPDARFCPRCGAPVAGALTEQRKVVTVLFADLVRSTELAGSLDPERLREVLGAFYAATAREISALRGTPEKFAGDAVMAVFGLPHAHDDDAVRAVRAALAIRDRAARLSDSLGLPEPLRVRAGVATGPVAVGTGSAGEPLVTGLMVNLSARLEQGAEPDETLVDGTTNQLTRHAVRYGEARDVGAKGFEDPVPAYPALGLEQRATRQTIPIVGRRREQALLADAMERVAESGRAHLFTILGEAGIGKTRLVEEFLARLPEEVRVLEGRAGAFEEDPAFAPVADMIRRHLGLSRDATTEVVDKRLREVVEGCCKPSESEQVAARLGLALGLGTGEEGRRYRLAEVRSGFLTWLAGFAEEGPVVAWFEDLHLARPETLDFVQEVVAGSRRAPVLFVATARDWFEHEDEAGSRWAAGLPDAFTIRLEPLREVEATELARAAAEGIDQETAARIASHAGGNPFFIVETTGMLHREAGDVAVAAPHGHPLPATVQAVVAARLDHLPETAREVVRRASIFPGASFNLSELRSVADVSESQLRELEDAETLLPDADRPEVWRFRHEMLRAVAYDSLPKRERLRLHLAVADALGQDRTEGRPHAVAYHLEAAAMASLDLDPRDRTVAERAVEALRHAGNVSRRRMESRTAVDLYRRALALAGPETGWGPVEARILSSAGESHYWLGEFDRGREHLERAFAIAGDDPWIRAHGGRFLADIELNVTGDQERARRLFEDALVAARELGDPWTVSRTLLMAGWEPYWRDDLEPARARFEEALEIARKEGDRWAEARALSSLAGVRYATGNEEEVLPFLEQALALGEEIDDPFTVAVARSKLGESYRRMLRLPEALENQDAAVRGFDELGARWELANALGERGAIHRLAGRMEDAERDLRAALDLCLAIGERAMVAWTVSQLTLTLVALGRIEDARRVFERNAPVAPADDPGSMVSLLVAETVLALVQGDTERARGLAARAVEVERGRSGSNSRPSVVWWAGRLFGPQLVGGEDEMDAARERLEAVGWRHSVVEPDLQLSALAPTGKQPTPAATS